jgi:hypothetical protein
VQHGTAATVLARAIRATDRLVRDRRSANYDEVLINNIYDARTDLVLGLAANRRHYNERERRGFRNSAINRYPEERREALRMLREGDQ